MTDLSNARDAEGDPDLTPPLLTKWKENAEYICRGSALTNAKNQAMRVLQLIEEIDRLRERLEQLEDY